MLLRLAQFAEKFVGRARRRRRRRARRIRRPTNRANNFRVGMLAQDQLPAREYADLVQAPMAPRRDLVGVRYLLIGEPHT
jgi:hypothetical protein